MLIKMIGNRRYKSAYLMEGQVFKVKPVAFGWEVLDGGFKGVFIPQFLAKELDL